MHICTSSLRERPVLDATSSSFASMVSGSRTDTTVDFATTGLHCGTINLSSCACNIRKSGESWCCRSAATKAAGQRPSKPALRGLNPGSIRWSTAAAHPAVRPFWPATGVWWTARPTASVTAQELPEVQRIHCGMRKNRDYKYGMQHSFKIRNLLFKQVTSKRPFCSTDKSECRISYRTTPSKSH